MIYEERQTVALESIAKSLEALVDSTKMNVYNVSLADTPVQKVTWGHGHVYPRIDGAKARCGGPGLCRECALDRTKLNSQRRQQDSRKHGEGYGI